METFSDYRLDMTPQEDHEKKQAEEIINRLGFYKAEWLDNQIFDFFSEPTYFESFKSHTSSVLIGGRGTGKTTALRGLSYQGQHSIKNSEEIENWSFFGLYYKINTNRISAFKGSGVSEDVWSKYFSHYINLIFCQLLLNLMFWYEKNTKNKIQISQTQIKKIKASFKITDSSIVDFYQLADEIDFLIASFEHNINNVVESPPIDLSVTGAPIDYLTSALMSDRNFENKKIYFLIDEFENLQPYQQVVFNTLIKHAHNGYVFKIGVREMGWRDKKTFNNEELNSPADYQLIDVSEILNMNSDNPHIFKNFAESVILSRINTQFSSPKDLLKKLSPMEEMDLFLGDSYAFDFIKNRKSEISDNLIKELEKIRSGELYFIENWYRKHNQEKLSLNDMLSSFFEKDQKETWTNRFNNHFQSLLFQVNSNKYSEIKKYYTGWDTFLYLSNGNIRYLLELVYISCQKEFQENRRIKDISYKNQTLATIEVGRKNIGEIEGLTAQGGQLKKLLLSLGRIFEVYAKTESPQAPEVNQFYVTYSGNNNTDDRVYDLLSQAVMHLVLVRFTTTKVAGSSSETKDFDYALHPIFAPFFNFSYRKKRKIKITESEFIKLIDNYPKEINGFLSSRNKTELDQLDLFGEKK